MKVKYLISILLVLGLLFTTAWTVWAQEGEEEEEVTTYDPPETPAIITLDQIPDDPEFGDFYGSVELNHMLHEGFGCEMCHHYFDMHGTPGIVIEERMTEDNCLSCHHTDELPLEEPMACDMCHEEGALDEFIEVKSNFNCTVCHDTMLKMQPRVIETEDEETGETTLYKIPALKAIYHQNCLVCHKDFGASTDCSYCHEPKEMAE